MPGYLLETQETAGEYPAFLLRAEDFWTAREINHRSRRHCPFVSLERHRKVLTQTERRVFIPRSQEDKPALSDMSAALKSPRTALISPR
jgi:hypothetical protein